MFVERNRQGAWNLGARARTALPVGFFARARRSWSSREGRFIWAGAAAVVLLCVIAALVVISRPGPTPTTYSAFTIDLSSASVVRGTGREPAKSEIQVPQELLDLSIQLPVGSEEGSYQVSLHSGPSVLWSQVAQAHLTDHVVRLKAQLDLRPFQVGRYEMTVESASGLRFVQPIQITKPKPSASRNSGWRDRLLATVASRLISIRLP